MTGGDIRLGAIGCGGFGLFSLQQFAQSPGIKGPGVAGTHPPAALSAAPRVALAEGVIALAGRNDRLVVANLMQRYNPLAEAVGRLIDSSVLGEILHGYFENYAADENLPPEHWFWDRAKSGGIFVEHGV